LPIFAADPSPARKSGERRGLWAFFGDTNDIPHVFLNASAYMSGHCMGAFGHVGPGGRG
jgi:hypothetical protein